MSQHDFNIANQTFPSFRSDLNDALQAAATISAGASAPTTPYPYQLWYDTANEKYKIRNAANSAWIDVFGLDASGNITIAADLSVDGGTIKLDGNYPVGTGNVALGDAALDDGSLSGGQNTAVGNIALQANTTGADNTAIGSSSLAANTTGTLNTASGSNALRYNTSGSNNTAQGRLALFFNTTGSNNTGIGLGALQANTTADYNTAVGTGALLTNATGTENAALGGNALYYNTGSYNTAVGMSALQSNTTANNNTAVGYQAGSANTTGAGNTALGRIALANNTTASDNVGIGNGALTNNTTGANNTASGRAALGSNTTASNNTAVGYYALLSNTTGAKNVAVGTQALNANTTASYETAIGYQAGYSTNTGNALSLNTFIGAQSGYFVTTGVKNTIIGGYTGNEGGLDIRTSNNNIVLSDGDGFPLIRIVGGASTNDIHRYYSGVAQPRLDFSATNFGYSGGYTVLQLGQTSGNHSVSIGYDPSGNSSGSFSGTGIETLFRRGMKFLTPNSADNTFYVQFTMTDGVTSGDFNDTSDVALKENIQTISSAWDTVSQLRPVTFDWKQEGRGTRSGFIAQEVEVLLPNDVIGDDYAAPDVENGIEGNSGKAINTTGIVAHLTKALQEAMDRIETLEAKVQALETN